MISRNLVTAGAILAAFWLVGTAHASDLTCTNPVRLNGEAKTGNDFLRAIPGKLIFALKAERSAPPNPYGWTISVYSGAAPQDDFVAAANPPYRGLNVRDLTLSYGQTAEQVVARNPRTFAFYTDTETNTLAEIYVRAHLWPDQSPNVPSEMPVAQGHGELKIDSYKFGTAGSTKIIASLKFHVTLCMAESKAPE
jgi:hypothetical protein